ncbi:MAG: sulfatase [Deltaproteobacteria bacterium]|nr:MAG: sulfatase [Deltaproteobacteria bacterium]
MGGRRTGRLRGRAVRRSTPTAWLGRLARCAALALTGATAIGCDPGPAQHSAPRHLALITVDTLRADRLGVYGYAAADTPSIDALAAESLRFERAYAHASATVPSMASLFTGQLPAQHGVLNNAGRIPAGAPTLAERLRGAGFATAAFVGNWALRPGRGFERAFETYTHSFIGREAVRPQPENPGRRLTDQALGWLDQRDPDARFLLWVHYQEPHGPYDPPSYDAQRGAEGAERERILHRSRTNSGRGAIPAYQWLGHGRLGDYLARYDGEVAETDRQIGRLLEGLRERRLLEDTLVILTADHGEAFGEENLYLAHGEGLGEVLVRVPLVIRMPGRPGAVRSDAVRLIDVAPTALALLGVEADGLAGQSLLREDGDRIAVAQLEPLRGGTRWRAIRDGRYELRETQPGGLALRDLERGGASLAPDAEPEVRSRLGAALRELAPWASAGAPPALSEQDREGLRALGYVD